MLLVGYKLKIVFTFVWINKGIWLSSVFLGLKTDLFKLWKHNTCGALCCLRKSKKNRKSGKKLRENMGSNESVRWSVVHKNLSKNHFNLGKAVGGAGVQPLIQGHF